MEMLVLVPKPDHHDNGQECLQLNLQPLSSVHLGSASPFPAEYRVPEFPAPQIGLLQYASTYNERRRTRQVICVPQGTNRVQSHQTGLSNYPESRAGGKGWNRSPIQPKREGWQTTTTEEADSETDFHIFIILRLASLNTGTSRSPENTCLICNPPDVSKQASKYLKTWEDPFHESTICNEPQADANKGNEHAQNLNGVIVRPCEVLRPRSLRFTTCRKKQTKKWQDIKIKSFALRKHNPTSPVANVDEECDEEDCSSQESHRHQDVDRELHRGATLGIRNLLLVFSFCHD